MSTPRTLGHTKALAVLGVLVALALVGAWILMPPVAGPAAAAAAAGAPADTARPVPGAQAPDFTPTDLDGKAVTLASLRGKPVWLTFGATRCADCRTEFPDLQAAHEASGVPVVAVYTGEDGATVGDYADRLGLSLTNVPDPKSEIAGSYRVMGVPTHFFIDGEGTVRSVRVGVLTREQMDAELAAVRG